MKPTPDEIVSAAPEHVQTSQGLRALGQQLADWDHGHAIIPPDVDPCCDLEWLELEAGRLAGLGHDAGKAAAEALRAIVRQMDSHGVWSVADLDAREAVRCEEHYQRYIADQIDEQITQLQGIFLDPTY
jgi:hypothetical protein